MMFIGGTTSIVINEREAPKSCRKMIYDGNTCMQTQQGVVNGYAKRVLQTKTPARSNGMPKGMIDGEIKIWEARSAPKNVSFVEEKLK